MKLLLILFIAGGLYGWITYKPPEKKKAPADPPPVVTVEYCKQREQERKQAARKAQAQRDIETQTERVRLLDALLDNAKLKYERATKDKDIERLTRQIISLEGQIAVAESRIEKAKYIVKYGG